MAEEKVTNGNVFELVALLLSVVRLCIKKKSNFDAKTCNIREGIGQQKQTQYVRTPIPKSWILGLSAFVLCTYPNLLMAVMI